MTPLATRLRALRTLSEAELAALVAAMTQIEATLNVALTRMENGRLFMGKEETP